MNKFKPEILDVEHEFISDDEACRADYIPNDLGRLFKVTGRELYREIYSSLYDENS
jgi:hypothetical protein